MSQRLARESLGSALLLCYPDVNAALAIGVQVMT